MKPDRKGPYMPTHTTAGRRRPIGASLGVALLAGTLLLSAGCAPGAKPQPTRTETAAVSRDLGTEPITLTVMTTTSETDKASINQLADAFRAHHPNVTVEVKSEQFTVLQQNGPRIISTPDTPDLIRFPTLGNTVKNGQLTQLDDYASLYGWDEFPSSQLNQWRVSDDGLQRGEGGLYGMGISFSLTGVYYNKELAAGIGMEQPPTTLEEFEDLLAKAGQTEHTALMSSGQDGALFWPFQALMLAKGAKPTLDDWVFNVPGASIDTPEAHAAAETLVSWADAGYLPDDVVALNNTDALARFTAGKAVFSYDGNWDAAAIDEAMGDNAGFFLLPPTADHGKFASMSDPVNYVIPAQSDQKDAAAAFLDFAFSDEGRAIMVSTTGQVPGGPADAALPELEVGPAIADTLSAFQLLNRDNGITPYIGNATASIYTDTIIPQFQLLVTGSVTPSDFVARLQSDYDKQLGR